MASVEEICSHIALINKSRKIIEGPINEIREKYANDTYQLSFRYAPDFKPEQFTGEEFEILSQKTEGNRQDIILQRIKPCNTNTLLNRFLPHIDILSYQKVIPGMNDIFIKLVKNQ